MELQTLETTRVTKEEVLEIFRDQHRHAVVIDDATVDEPLSPQMSVTEWRDVCDLLPWRQVATALNQEWGMNASRSQWRTAMVPESKRTLGDVCELIAEHGQIERVTAPKVLGRACRPAGMFFAVKELLRRAGADVTDLRPSTSLGQYACEHCGEFTYRISALRPGALPVVEYSHPQYDRASNLLISSLLAFMVSLGLTKWFPLAWIPFGVLFLLAHIYQYCVAKYSVPERVSFGELKTFGDLCNALSRT